MHRWLSSLPSKVKVIVNQSDTMPQPPRAPGSSPIYSRAVQGVPSARPDWRFEEVSASKNSLTGRPYRPRRHCAVGEMTLWWLQSPYPAAEACVWQQLTSLECDVGGWIWLLKQNEALQLIPPLYGDASEATSLVSSALPDVGLHFLWSFKPRCTGSTDWRRRVYDGMEVKCNSLFPPKILLCRRIPERCNGHEQAEQRILAARAYS